MFKKDDSMVERKEFMNGVVIKIIPHKEQRYETAGDWFFDADNILQIRVSKMSNWRYEQLVAYHEYAEAMICLSRGIEEKDVSDFDIKFEEIRKQYPEIIGDMEPGYMITAPYYKPHRTATHLERVLAEELGVEWKSYEKVVNNLTQ